MIDRPRGETQINRPAILIAQPTRRGGIVTLLALTLHIVERPLQYDRQFIEKGRLEGREAILRQADERRADGLMRAAFRGQRDTARGRHEDESGILIAGIVERIETALDERVIERADWNEPRAEK